MRTSRSESACPRSAETRPKACRAVGRGSPLGARRLQVDEVRSLPGVLSFRVRGHVRRFFVGFGQRRWSLTAADRRRPSALSRPHASGLAASRALPARDPMTVPKVASATGCKVTRSQRPAFCEDDDSACPVFPRESRDRPVVLRAGRYRTLAAQGSVHVGGNSWECRESCDAVHSAERRAVSPRRGTRSCPVTTRSRPARGADT